MWIFLNNAFFSIVANRDDPDTLLVRGRRRGDLESAFPRAAVTTTPDADYRFRAAIPRHEVAAAVGSAISALGYTNFEASVGDSDRHAAYSAIWRTLRQWQDEA